MKCDNQSPDDMQKELAREHAGVRRRFRATRELYCGSGHFFTVPRSTNLMTGDIPMMWMVFAFFDPGTPIRKLSGLISR